MRRLACIALLGVGCTAANPDYRLDDGGSSEGTGADVATSSGPTSSGPDDEGSTTGGPADTTDADASASSSGDPVCSEECGDHATCVNTGSGPECACDPGYDGDGLSCVPIPMFPSLSWQLDCMGSSASCECEDACVVDAPMDVHEVVRSDTAVLMADPESLYQVTLHVRAVVEPKIYEGGDTNDHWNEGGTPADDGRNVAYIEVEDPPRVIYVNAGASLERHCLEIDQGFMVRMRGGSPLEIGTIDPDNCAIVNIDEPGGQPISFPDVETPPQPHDGQFMLVDVMSIEAE
jgi:hypothetical protein